MHEGLAADGKRTIPTRVGRTGPRTRCLKCAADHPHACGENGLLDPFIRSAYGPSPRVWGELGEECRARHQSRTIPTRVGRTIPAPSSCRMTSDHPHACGENLLPTYAPQK